MPFEESSPVAEQPCTPVSTPLTAEDDQRIIDAFDAAIPHIVDPTTGLVNDPYQYACQLVGALTPYNATSLAAHFQIMLAFYCRIALNPLTDNFWEIVDALDGKALLFSENNGNHDCVASVNTLSSMIRNILTNP